MKIRGNRETILKAAQRAANVSDKKTALPILGSVLIRAESEGDVASVTFAATDLVLSIVAPIVCAVLETGSVAIEAGELVARIRAMPAGEDVILETDESDNVTIYPNSGRKLRFALGGVDGEDFPAIELSSERGNPVSVNCAELSRMLSQTVYAVSNDDTRVHLSALLCKLGKEGSEFVSTDGHRMAIAKGEAVESNIKALIPRRGAFELKRLVGDAVSEGVESCFVVQVGKTTIFGFGAYLFGVTNADATFPPYEQVLTTIKSSTQVSASPWIFADRAKTVGIATDGRTGGMLVNVRDGEILLSAKTGGVEATDSLDAQVTGNTTSEPVGINWKYLVEALSPLQDESVTVHMGGALDPIKIEHSGGLAVLMPMRA